MTVTEPVTRPDTAERARFVDETTRDAAHGFATLRSTGTLPDGAAVGALERIPGEDAALALVDGGLGLRRRGLQVAERALAPPAGVTAGGAPEGGAGARHREPSPRPTTRWGSSRCSPASPS